MLRILTAVLLLQQCLGQQYTPLRSWSPFSSPLLAPLISPQLSVYPAQNNIYRNIPTEYLRSPYSSQSTAAYMPYSPYPSYSPGVVQPSFGNPFLQVGNSLLQNTPSYGAQFQSPLPGRATAAPVPKLDPRALCSFCSCDSDFGCAYNCNKCEALCFTCDCDTSLGCQYNCDKCENRDSTGTLDTIDDNQDSGDETSDSSLSSPSSPSAPASATAVVAGDGCEALKSSQLELCLWGPSCKSIVSNLFPNCNYNCNTCQLLPSESCVAEDGPAAGQPCVFPFIYQGFKYNGCAPLHSSSGDLKFWCSTRTDINGFHVRGQYPEVGKFVGYCADTCPKAVPTTYY